MTLNTWILSHYKLKASSDNYSHARLGQAFCNLIYDWASFDYDCLKPTLFYVSNDEEALSMIESWLESKPNDYFENLTEDL